jgi:hypothetical protein
MTYRGHLQDLAHGQSFGIVIDDETMTWSSDPPGGTIERPMTTYFPREGGGPPGSGRNFEVLPGGKVRSVK